MFEILNIDRLKRLIILLLRLFSPCFFEYLLYITLHISLMIKNIMHE